MKLIWQGEHELDGLLWSRHDSSPHVIPVSVKMSCVCQKLFPYPTALSDALLTTLHFRGLFFCLGLCWASKLGSE